MPASTGSEVSSIRKRKPGPGRPKGSKNRPKAPRIAVQTGNGHRQLVENSQHHGQERNMVDHGTAGPSSHHPSISAPTECGSAEPMGPSNAVPMTPFEVSRQCPAEVSEAVSIISGESRGAKRKRKAPTTDPNVAQVTGSASVDPEVATQIAIDTASDPVTREVPAPEMTTNAVPLGQPGNGMQQSAKRRKPMKEIPRQPAPMNRFGSSSDHSQTVSTPVAASSHTSQQRPSTEQINSRNADAEDHAEIIPSQTISQMSMSISHSTHSQSTSSHQDGPELRVGFSPRRDTNAFGGPANDGVYQGLMTQQSPFGTQMAMATSPDGNYRNPARRSVQNQSPAFPNRRVQHAAPTGMPPFHGYSDPAFLEMTGLDSTGQASLSMGQQPYGMTSTSIQRPSSSLGAPYQTASEISHSASFDGSVTESTLRERMYHTLRRQ
ncbi:DNA binding domain with preference for a t rich regions-like protein [Colletotrichum asianum]